MKKLDKIFVCDETMQIIMVISDKIPIYVHTTMKQFIDKKDKFLKNVNYGKIGFIIMEPEEFKRLLFKITNAVQENKRFESIEEAVI